MNLPPLLQAYSTSLNVSFPYGTLTASTKLFEKENVADKWAWEPFKADVTWTLPYDIRTAIISKRRAMSGCISLLGGNIFQPFIPKVAKYRKNLTRR